MTYDQLYVSAPIKEETFVIYDWAGNYKFVGETFDSIDDAFGRIAEYLEKEGMSDDEIEESLGEYQVLPK